MNGDMNEWGGEKNGEGIPIVLICVKEREGEKEAVFHLPPSNFPVLAAAIMPTLLLPPLQLTTFLLPRPVIPPPAGCVFSGDVSGGDHGVHSEDRLLDRFVPLFVIV